MINLEGSLLFKSETESACVGNLVKIEKGFIFLKMDKSQFEYLLIEIYPSVSNSIGSQTYLESLK